jgi:hypothetical protein
MCAMMEKFRMCPRLLDFLMSDIHSNLNYVRCYVRIFKSAPFGAIQRAAL